jgi:hypothetical protein
MRESRLRSSRGRPSQRRGLRDCKIIAEEHAQVNRAVSATDFIYKDSGALPQANIGIAPLALKHPAYIHAASEYDVLIALLRSISCALSIT